MTFVPSWKEVNNTVIEAQTYQNLPFQKLVAALKIQQDLSRHPVFQIMFGVSGFGRHAERLFKSVPLDNLYKPAKFESEPFY